jgi:hypothetical protein
MYFPGVVDTINGVFQRVPVPRWAESAAVYFYAWMESNEGRSARYDWLEVLVTADEANTLLALGEVNNQQERLVWNRWRLSVPGISSYRGAWIVLEFAGVNDRSYPTSWYVDNVQLIFACGALAAGLEARDLPPTETTGGFTRGRALVPEAAAAPDHRADR